MTRPHLVLQYPDLQTGKVRLLAVTQDARVLAVFKRVVIEEANLNFLGCDDNVLQIEYGEELRKLRKILDVLIPEQVGEEG